MAKQQAPSSVFLVRPAAFDYNEQTATSNVFQKKPTESIENIRYRAIQEFDAMVQLLKEHEIDVHVFEDTPQPPKPDAIFPNNWISLHENGKLILYPMLTSNRRIERSMDIVQTLKTKFMINEVIDFSSEEVKLRIVEGTGSIVFDHVNEIAYANRSDRTNEELVREVAATLGHQSIIFNAADAQTIPIYHTNVLMCVAEKFVIICLEAIQDEIDQELLLASFMKTEHKVIAISYTQMDAFAGNMLEVKNIKGESIVLLSQTAFNSLLPGQVDAITRFTDVLPLSIPTIETYGGGSVRCMVAGIHAPKKT